MALKLITPASALAVTLAEAKLQCQVDGTEQDALITSLIAAATKMAEQYTGRCIMAQTWELSLDAFPTAIELTKVSVSAVSYIKYTDTSGVLQTLSNTLYTVNSSSDFGITVVVPTYQTLWPDTSDTINAVVCRYVAGYAAAADVPEGIKQWIKIMVRTMLDNPTKEIVDRSTVSSLGYVDSLLDPFKVYPA